MFREFCRQQKAYNMFSHNSKQHLSNTLETQIGLAEPDFSELKHRSTLAILNSAMSAGQLKVVDQTGIRIPDRATDQQVVTGLNRQLRHGSSLLSKHNDSTIILDSNRGVEEPEYEYSGDHGDAQVYPGILNRW